MDVSSELVHSLLPVFMTSVLGVSLIGVGLIEGLAEATASILKVVSGSWSDRLPRRKPVVAVGYALSALTKPLFPMASGISEVITARFLDRIGKGIRGAPRDALIADVTDHEHRARAYGLRQSLDSIGAFMGPLAAIALMMLWANDLRAVLWVAVIPAVLCVMCIVFYVREPRRSGIAQTHPMPLSRANLARFPAQYWWIVTLGGVLTLARFSDAFLVLRAQSVGFDLAWIPAVMTAMNIVYASVAAPAGAAVEKFGARRLMLSGIVVLIVADIVLAQASTFVGVLFGAALWGLHMGLTQGLLLALVAEHAPADLRGTAFGAFHLATGGLTFVASALAGAVWQWYGPETTFYLGLGFALMAGIGFVTFTNRYPNR